MAERREQPARPGKRTGAPSAVQPGVRPTLALQQVKEKNLAAASTATTSSVCQEVCTMYKWPQLYAEPCPVSRWETAAARGALEDLLWAVGAAAKAQEYAFGRDESGRVHRLAVRLEELARADIAADERALFGRCIGLSMVKQARTDLISHCARVWQDIQVRFEPLADTAKAKNYDINDPSASNLIVEGSMHFEAAGMYIGSGLNGWRRVLAHASGLAEDTVDHVLSVDAEVAADMTTSAASIMERGDQRQNFISLLAQRCGIVHALPLPPPAAKRHGILVRMLTAECTRFARMDMATGRVPSDTR